MDFSDIVDFMIWLCVNFVKNTFQLAKLQKLSNNQSTKIVNDSRHVLPMYVVDE